MLIVSFMLVFVVIVVTRFLFMRAMCFAMKRDSIKVFAARIRNSDMSPIADFGNTKAHGFSAVVRVG